MPKVHSRKGKSLAQVTHLVSSKTGCWIQAQSSIGKRKQQIKRPSIAAVKAGCIPTWGHHTNLRVPDKAMDLWNSGKTWYFSQGMRNVLGLRCRSGNRFPTPHLGDTWQMFSCMGWFWSYGFIIFGIVLISSCPGHSSWYLHYHPDREKNVLFANVNVVVGQSSQRVWGYS